MFSPLKTFTSTFFLFIGFFIISTVSSAQKSAKYFRYFEVEIEQSIDLTNDLRSDVFAESPFQIHSSCDSRHSIIIAVPADYPKRIPQIEEELKQSLESVMTSEKIESIHTVKASDLESFCK